MFPTGGQRRATLSPAFISRISWEYWGGRGKDAPPLECPGELARRLVKSAIGFRNTFPLDSDLSGG